MSDFNQKLWDLSQRVLILSNILLCFFAAEVKFAWKLVVNANRMMGN